MRVLIAIACVSISTSPLQAIWPFTGCLSRTKTTKIELVTPTSTGSQAPARDSKAAAPTRDSKAAAPSASSPATPSSSGSTTADTSSSSVQTNQPPAVAIVNTELLKRHAMDLDRLVKGKYAEILAQKTPAETGRMVTDLIANIAELIKVNIQRACQTGALRGPARYAANMNLNLAKLIGEFKLNSDDITRQYSTMSLTDAEIDGIDSRQGLQDLKTCNYVLNDATRTKIDNRINAIDNAIVAHTDAIKRDLYENNSDDLVAITKDDFVGLLDRHIAALENYNALDTEYVLKALLVRARQLLYNPTATPQEKDVCQQQLRTAVTYAAGMHALLIASLHEKLAAPSRSNSSSTSSASSSSSSTSSSSSSSSQTSPAAS